MRSGWGNTLFWSLFYVFIQLLVYGRVGKTEEKSEKQCLGLSDLSKLAQF